MVISTRAKVYLATYLVLCANFAHASTFGRGEYAFGPETAQNIACTIAEERAKKNVIDNFVGEMIEHETDQICKDETCSTLRSFYSDTSGQIKKIHKLESLVYPEKNHSVCEVHIEADVEKIKNSIDLTIQSKQHFEHGERFKVTGISNRVGSLGVFNVIDGKHNLIWQGKVLVPKKEFSLPAERQKLEARVPRGKNQLNELLVFVFTEDNLTFQPTYSKIEFEQMVKDLPFLGRKIVTKQIQIVRK